MNAKKNRFIILFVISLVQVFSFISCTKKTACKTVNAIPREMKLNSVNFMSKAESAAFRETEEIYEESAGMSSQDAQAVTERKLIKTGNLTLEVENLTDIEETVNDFAKSFNGYITNSSTEENYFSVTVKVPESNFEEAMNRAGSLGKIKYRSVNNTDVTEEFYDLKTRLETKKIMQKKLEVYLGQAKDIKDLLEVERQLNNVTSEIEVMEGRMKRLVNQIDFSTIYMTMNLPTGFDREGFKWPDLGEDFRAFGENFVNFIAKLFISIFYIFIFGIPIVFVLAFLFWLLFGRVGLLVKLFKWLKKK